MQQLTQHGNTVLWFETSEPSFMGFFTLIDGVGYEMPHYIWNDCGHLTLANDTMVPYLLIDGELEEMPQFMALRGVGPTIDLNE